MAKKTLSVKQPEEKKAEAKKDLSETYNEFKEFEGRQYTGMKIGRSHRWNYDQGDWKERKITPDLWEISYAVTKRRAGKAPEGSGVPVGTGYHWYIVAHQNVRKLNANDYTTSMSGLKFKLAHKRADKEKWSSSTPAQRKKLIRFFQELIDQLQQEPVPIVIEHKGKEYKGGAIPIADTYHDGVYDMLDITLNDEHLGLIRCTKSGWKMDGLHEKGLVDAIGEEIFLWFR